MGSLVSHSTVEEVWPSFLMLLQFIVLCGHSFIHNSLTLLPQQFSPTGPLQPLDAFLLHQFCWRFAGVLGIMSCWATYWTPEYFAIKRSSWSTQWLQRAQVTIKTANLNDHISTAVLTSFNVVFDYNTQHYVHWNPNTAKHNKYLHFGVICPKDKCSKRLAVCSNVTLQT